MKNNTFESFLQVYYSNLGNCSYEQSYEKTESWYKDKFGKRKYKNYSVFKSTVSRYMQKVNNPA
jgi:hypothetical protein